MTSRERLIRQLALRYGVDPDAVVAVAGVEGAAALAGGTSVGDGGTSFGPFQLHEGGALPSGRDSDWAHSPAGIEYAIRKLAESGAQGLKGRAAVAAIVTNFERPKDPQAEIDKAWGLYGRGASTNGRPASADQSIQGLTHDALRSMAAAQLLQQAQSYAAGRTPDYSGLLSLATARRNLGAANQAFGAGPTSGPVAGGGGRLGPLVMPLGTQFSGRSEFAVPDPEGAPNAQGQRFHAGKDWFALAGSGVYAPTGGTIVEVKPSRGNSGQVYGGTVKVRGPNGRVFVFRHVNPGSFRIGQQIKSGQLIASVADWTGGSDHAHIEVWKTLQGGYRLENMIDPAAVFGRTKPKRKKRA